MMAVNYAHTSTAETKRHCKAKVLARFCYSHGILEGVPRSTPHLAAGTGPRRGRAPTPITPTASAPPGRWSSNCSRHEQPGTSSTGSLRRIRAGASHAPSSVDGARSTVSPAPLLRRRAPVWCTRRYVMRWPVDSAELRPLPTTVTVTNPPYRWFAAPETGAPGMGERADSVLGPSRCSVAVGRCGVADFRGHFAAERPAAPVRYFGGPAVPPQRRSARTIPGWCLPCRIPGEHGRTVEHLADAVAAEVGGQQGRGRVGSHW